MKQYEGLKLHGRWRLTARYKGTDIIYKVLEGENIICNVGKYLIGDMLIDETGFDTGLTYHALGASATAVAVGDTQLTDEGGGAAMRKVITSKSRLLKVLTYSTFFTAGQSTLAILEAGIFGHSTASGSENSGIMFSHYLVAFDNSGGLFDLTFDYILTIG